MPRNINSRPVTSGKQDRPSFRVYLVSAILIFLSIAGLVLLVR